MSATLGVVLATVTGALVNELHNGWGWSVWYRSRTCTRASTCRVVATRSTTSETSRPNQINVGGRDVYATQDGDIHVRRESRRPKGDCS